MDGLRQRSSWVFHFRNKQVRSAVDRHWPARAVARSVIVCAALAPTAVAAAYPDKPIRLIVPSASGGSPDVMSRLIANELGKQTGLQVVVENRPGASGIIVPAVRQGIE